METFLRLENRHTGEILKLCRVRADDGELVLLIDGSLPPGAQGPPPHIHFYEREEGTVKSGKLAARVGRGRGMQTVRASVGEAGVFPAGVVHSWWNGGDDLLEISGRAVPAVDLDSYLQALFAIFNASPSGRPSLFYIAHVLWRHRRTQALANPPRFIQMTLLPF